MVVVIGVVALIIICCFGCGTLLVCSYQISKASKQIVEVQKKHAAAIEMKKKGVANASESQIEVDQQYVMPEDMDPEIFAKKNRKLKGTDDVVAEDAEISDERPSVNSSRPIVNDSDRTVDNLDMSSKKLVSGKAKRILAGLKTVKQNK